MRRCFTEPPRASRLPPCASAKRMIHLIGDIFPAHELEALAEAVEALPFEDGKNTAGVLARAVKDNAQASPGPDRDAVLRKASASLLSSAEFCSVARPRGFARLLISRYAGGQSYGLHVDDAIMDGARTDLSFTLCLSAPESYEGGALVVSDAVEDRAFRPASGEAIVYPSDTLHRVEPVTNGVRFAIVGWVTSWVRDPAKRQILRDLDLAVAAEQTGAADPAQIARLAQSRSNLIRLWAE